jgi:glycerophosphoryl diester phosphodiesterase
VARPLVLAHRGARERAPENTIAAFTVALEQGADGVELDVHRTADGQVVVHHDAEAPGLGVLAHLPFDEIRVARPEIPTLVEALDVCVGRVVNVEIKILPGDADFDAYERTAELVVETLMDRGRTDRVIISSFSLATVDRVRELDADIPTAFIVMFGIDPLEAVELCVERGHGALHPNLWLLGNETAAQVAERAHAHGLQVNVWTVNDADEMRRLEAAGVDGLITDVPDVALGALG